MIHPLLTKATDAPSSGHDMPVAESTRFGDRYSHADKIKLPRNRSALQASECVQYRRPEVPTDGLADRPQVSY